MSWKCKHLYRHTWEETLVNAVTLESTSTLHGSFSCTYYWKNPRLIKDFVSQYGETRHYHYWAYSYEGQMERKKMNRDNGCGLSGHSDPAKDILVDSYNKTFHSHKESKNFPYSFNLNTVCMGCKFFLK